MKQTDTLTDNMAVTKVKWQSIKKAILPVKTDCITMNNKPSQKNFFYNECNCHQKVTAPRAYIIPQQWWRVIDILRNNKIGNVANAKR
nr:hypothetical protein [Bacteroidota bacterium]